MGGSDETAYAIAKPDSAKVERSSLTVCLVSGGMYSCVTAAIAKQEADNLTFLHVSYGQLTEERERRAFAELADHFQVEQRLIVSLEHLAQIGGSSLTDKAVEVSRANLSNTNIPTSYVPFRNAHLLSVATSWAEVIGANFIYIGAADEDSSGYPDCRPEFYHTYHQVITLGTTRFTEIEVKTPVIALKKSEIIKLGV